LHALHPVQRANIIDTTKNKIKNSPQFQCMAYFQTTCSHLTNICHAISLPNPFGVLQQ
jgi:hypothetical protein